MTATPDIDTQIESLLDDLNDSIQYGEGVDLDYYHSRADLHKAIKTLLIQSKINSLEKLDVRSEPREADKTPQPEMERVDEHFGGVSVTTTEATGRTYTEQDEENLAFEVAQPYLDEVRTQIQDEIKALKEEL